MQSRFTLPASKLESYHRPLTVEDEFLLAEGLIVVTSAPCSGISARLGCSGIFSIACFASSHASKFWFQAGLVTWTQE